MSEEGPPSGPTSTMNYVYPCTHCLVMITLNHSKLLPVAANVLGIEWRCSDCYGWTRVQVVMPYQELTIKRGPAADAQSGREGAAVGEPIYALSIEGKAVLSYMAKVHKMRALAAEAAKTNPAVIEEVRMENLKVARSLRRQRKILEKFLDSGEGTGVDRTDAAENLRLVIHAQTELKLGGIEAVNS
jgi:hypothetical protein